MNEINSFTIYEEYYELITLLSEREQQELALSIMKYMFEGIEPNLNNKQMKVFKNLKRPLDKSKQQSKRKSKKKPNENQKETKQKPKVQPKENTSNDVDVNVIVNSNVNNLYEYIESNFGRTLNPIEYEEISSWEDNELTRYAVREAVLNGAYSIKYIVSILQNWKNKNIRTIAEAQKNNRKHKGENTPEWFDKKIEGKKLDTENEIELKELIENYE